MPGAVFARGDGATPNTVRPEDDDFLETVHDDPANRAQSGISLPWDETGIAAVVEEGDDSAVFLVCSEGEPRGVVVLVSIDHQARTAEPGYLFHPEQRDGYATAEAALGVGHAFDDLDLATLSAEVVAGNAASARVLEKLGFRAEGRFREHEYANGERVDVLQYGLLAREWDGPP